MDWLRSILEHKRRELAEGRRHRPARAPVRRPVEAARDFAAALRRPGLAAIAEIKRRSPSRGALRPDLDPAALARSYAAGGAAAVSVLTDGRFFGGSLEDLLRARRAGPLPVLRKDFVCEAGQLHETRQAGADAVLLIARILSAAQLRDYLALARELGLAALVEVHDAPELERALDCGAAIIGVNNRDLRTQRLSLETALRLRPQIPAGRIAVAESGIRSRQDVRRLAEAGYDAILVGQALLQAPDPGLKLAELLGGAA